MLQKSSCGNEYNLLLNESNLFSESELSSGYKKTPPWHRRVFGVNVHCPLSGKKVTEWHISDSGQRTVKKRTVDQTVENRTDIKNSALKKLFNKFIYFYIKLFMLIQLTNAVFVFLLTFIVEVIVQNWGLFDCNISKVTDSFFYYLMSTVRLM